MRIVAFSFYDLGLNREDVEFYTHGGMLTAHQPSRLMLVTDRQMTLTADCGAFANWSGTVSNMADGEDLVGAYSTRHHSAAVAGKIWTGNSLK